ncbi:MAG: class I SAM-dependent methyltransferase [Myxococcota bacterium]
MAEYVHGGTDAREVARLEKQAVFTAEQTFASLGFAPGMRVLDLACGVGATGGLLQRRFPGVDVVGLDLSAAQLGASRRNHPALPVVRADATRLPFADATFDGVHCSWLLEHVPDPLGVLREVRRVLAPGAWGHFIEVDNATLALEPPSAAVTELMRRLNEAQRAAGGDPFIGRRVEQLFGDAGFAEVRVERRALHGHEGEPRFFQAFIEEFAEIFEGLDESLGDGALRLIDEASRAVRGLRQVPGSALRYTPALVHARR